MRHSQSYIVSGLRPETLRASEIDRNLTPPDLMSLNQTVNDLMVFLEGANTALEVYWPPHRIATDFMLPPGGSRTDAACDAENRLAHGLRFPSSPRHVCRANPRVGRVAGLRRTYECRPLRELAGQVPPLLVRSKAIASKASMTYCGLQLAVLDLLSSGEPLL